jgi:hypothetical protein
LFIRRLAAFAIAATAALAAVAGTAGARSNSTATQVFIDGYTDHYYEPPKRAPDAVDLLGHVLSPKTKCTIDRRLDVYTVEPGPNTKLGHTTSDTNGGWSFLIPAEDFNLDKIYYAVAPKRKLAHHKSCHADTSDPFTPAV